MSARTPLPTSWGLYPEGRIFRVKLRSSSFSSVLCCSRNPVVIKTNKLNAEMIPSTACTRRDHERRRVLEHNFAGGSRTENIRSAIFVGRFPFRLLANSLHKWPHTRPWITLIPKQKLYLSCKSFSTVGSLAVAQIPFQLLCSEWSQIQAGWPLKQVERRTKHESRPNQSYFFNSSFLPSKRVRLAVAPN